MNSSWTHSPAITAFEAGRGVWGSEWRPGHFAAAPGRIELIGNHIDYSGGPVLAAAIDRGCVTLRDADSPEKTLEFVLADFGPSVVQCGDGADFDQRGLTHSQEPADFVKGTVAALRSRALPVNTGRFSISSTVPMGAGVSSSAALCVSLALALSASSLDAADVVLIAQEAEHRAGSPCGTMDQSASVAGGTILFDGSSASFEQFAVNQNGYSFAVIDSGVPRVLAQSSYPLRVEECHRARNLLSVVLDRQIDHLASLSPEDLERAAQKGFSEEEPILFQRCRHVVSETQRVHKAVLALERGDWPTFGELMSTSGRSSATDYAISHPIVEEIVSRVRQVPDVLGARMMGGGEGGAVIALVKPPRQKDEMVEAIAAAAQDPERLIERPVYLFADSQGAYRGNVEFENDTLSLSQ